jgi:DNA-directed RNA polymerase subunit beta
MTYAAPIKVTTQLMIYDHDENGGKMVRDIKEQEVYFGEIPLMTPTGTFVINGTERVVVSQLHRSPGVFFDHDKGKTHSSGKLLHSARVIPYRGSWLDFEFDPKNLIYVRIDRRRKMHGTVLLRALGFSTQDLLNYYYQTETIFFLKENTYEKSVDFDLLPGQRATRDIKLGKKVIVKRNQKFTRGAIRKLREAELTRLPLDEEELYGKVSAHDIIDPETGEVIVECNEELTEEKVALLRETEIETVEALFIDGLNVGSYLRDTLIADKIETQDDAILEIYRRLRPGDPPTLDTARQLFHNLFFNEERYDLSRVGRLKLNYKFYRDLTDDQKPALDVSVLTPQDILETVRHLIELKNGRGSVDDIDHLGNRRVRAVGELMENQYRVGLVRMERAIKERMSMSQEIDTLMPHDLINSKPVSAVVKEYFGSSQLSQFMDQTNPLSEVTHKRRLSALGPGGLTRERAGFEVRDVHATHYGRICPIETPEGPNIGLIASLSTYARVNEYGFVETPYRTVAKAKVSDEILWYSALEEEGRYIAQATAGMDPKGNFKEDTVSARFNGDFRIVPADMIQLMDVAPQQMVSVAAALVPFLEHDDANRALMGANMQRQAVPLVCAEAPYIGTGIEVRAAFDAADMVLAREAGTVLAVDGDSITVDYRKEGEFRHQLLKFERSNQDTCINQRSRVQPGDKVRANQLLADGPSTDHGELALGKNLLVAFMSWEGYNFEDAIIVSERLVKDDVLTSIHIHEHEIDARDTKLGPEEITQDIPNLSDEILADLDDLGIIRVGAEVGPGDVLVGKVTPKGETELTPEERLLRAIFGEKAREVRDTSLKVPHGESGKVIDRRLFNRDDGDELPPGVNQLVRVHVAQKRKISVGDKLAGRHGNKGVISKVLPIEDMPFLADGTPVDIILNPLGVPSRMNVGQVLEAHLGYGARWGWDIDGESVGDQPIRGTETKTRPSTLPAIHVATPVFDGAHWDEEDRAGRHPTIQKVLENIRPESADGERLVGRDGKAVLYNGRDGETYDRPITVGYVYILKLAHLVDDKIHARSTGPYSMITQQPLGGKAQFGGQRFGEMEVWALEAYGAAYCLQELLTIKSDDVLGRVKVYEAIVKGDNIPEPGIPESFKVLIKEMQSLCLDVEVLDEAGQEVEIREINEDVYRTTEELGIDLSRPERGSDEEDERRSAGLLR